MGGGGDGKEGTKGGEALGGVVEAIDTGDDTFFVFCFVLFCFVLFCFVLFCFLCCCLCCYIVGMLCLRFGGWEFREKERIKKEKNNTTTTKKKTNNYKKKKKKLRTSNKRVPQKPFSLCGGRKVIWPNLGYFCVKMKCIVHLSSI